jgi:hypothetical protein
VVEVAFARILAFEPKFSISPEEEFSATETLIAKVYECRVAVLGVYRKLRIAFDLMKRVQLFCVARKYKGMGWDIENGLTQIFLQFLSGKATVHRWVKEMHRIVRYNDIFRSLHTSLTRLADFSRRTSSKPSMRNSWLSTRSMSATEQTC